MLDELLLHLRRRLRVPVPPGTPDTWTTLMALYGVAAPFDPRYTSRLVGVLLHGAGRPVAVDEQGLLLWVTPLAAGGSATDRLIDALDSVAAREAIALLGQRGDRTAIPALEARLAHHGHPLRGPLWIALARLGVAGDGLERWDPDHAIEQLVARLLLAERGLAADVDELPTYFPASLQRWLDGEPMGDELLTLARQDERLREPVARLLLLRPEGVFAHHVPTLAAFCLEDPLWWPTLPASDPVLADALLDALRHDEWEVRAGAAVLLGERPLPDGAASALRGLLDDVDPDVRREAALALHRHDPTVPLGVPSARYGYAERAGVAGLDGPPVGGAGWSLLAHPHGGEGSARVLLSLALQDPRRFAPLFEAFCLDRARDQPLLRRQAAAAALLQGCHVPSELPEVQRILLRPPDHPTSPAGGSDPATLAALVARDADWEVRLGALRLLARSGTPLATHTPLLRIVAGTDSDPTVREEARALLPASYGVPDVGDLLADCLVPRPDAPDRARLLGALHRADRALGEGVAAGLVDTGQREIAVPAARLVAGSLAPGEVPSRARAMLDDLASDHWVQREVAAAFLGGLSREALGDALADELAETLLKVASEDPDEDVRRMASWAATALGSA
jgi:HEAT repeat protein